MTVRSTKRRRGLARFSARTDSEEHQRYVAFFQQVRETPQHTKGLLRIA